MTKYYSQHGEDFILNKFFNKNDGFFVEVGCIDGKVYSNSLFFERLGWKGVCIEAHSGYIELIKQNRPGSTVVHCAIGEKDEGEVIFYANSRGSLSSLDKSTEERWKRDYAKYFTGFEEQKVQKRTLTSVFDEIKVNQIDFISIDIEGYEVQAIQGLDFLKYKPKVIVVESDSREHKLAIEEMLAPHGYQLIVSHGGNLFYSIDQSYKKKMGDKNYFDIPIVRSAHPVDKIEDRLETISIILHPQPENLYKRIKRRLLNIIRSINNRGDQPKVAVPQQRKPSAFMDIGFHGDKYLLQIVDFLMRQNVEVFIETGTNVATTLAYVAKNYPTMECYSCEPDLNAYQLAKNNTINYKNVHLSNLLSQDFIKMIKKENPGIFKKKTFFWLDAHSYGFDWPLKEEVRFVTENFENAYLMIDDFRVPHNSLFGFDRYKDQICAHEFIVDEIGQRDYQLFYPAYSEKTSAHHPLQGWGLYVFGEKINFPDSISKYVQAVI